jgi:hypothetical protein
MVIVQVILKGDPRSLDTRSVIHCGYDSAWLLFGRKPFHEHIVARRDKQVVCFGTKCERVWLPETILWPHNEPVLEVARIN